jgi:hypothetical protein
LISLEKLSQQQLQEILIDVMLKENEIKNFNASDIVEYIKQEVLLVINR